MGLPVPAFSPEAPSTVRLRSGVDSRYRSLFVIGRGGMGNVEVALECAEGPDGFDRIVALKTLLPGGARDPRHKEMFLREARLAALLRHRNVVHAFAYGDLHGELFLAMEYVAGEPLSRVLAAARASNPSKGLDPAIVAFVLAEACDGLHAAHELRDVGGLPLHVVHRDVSPHNVMVAYGGQVKILDFGVAKFDTGGHETRTGEIKGKMAYMSPEQALGEKLDWRSDLFSVGAVLFECMTGERMWGSGTDLEVMRKLALERPPALDAALPGAPPALVKLHASLVARDPAGRPATARDVALELRAFANARGVPPDAVAVRGLMRRLFAAEEKGRRTQLTEALTRVAPENGKLLRQRLDSSAEVDESTSTEAVVVGPQSGRRSRRPGGVGAARSRLGLAVALAGAVVVGAGVTAGTMRRSVPSATPAAAGNVSEPAPVLPATGSTPAASAAAQPRSTAEGTRAPAMPSATSRPAATKTNAPGGHPAIPARPAPAARTRFRGEGRLPSQKLPDVDPTPF